MLQPITRLTSNTKRSLESFITGHESALNLVINEKPLLIAATTKDMVKKHGIHAGNLVRDLAKVVGGGGGGRPDLAQAGGRDADKLPAAMEKVPELVAQMISNSN